MTALARRFPSLRLARIALGEAPSPVLRLRGLEGDGGGGEIWCKQEGLYGGRYGGNKARKLEYVLADAQARGKRTILSFGGIGTHHGLATAIYARSLGMRTVLLLIDQPETPHALAQLDKLRRAGAVIYRTHGSARTAVAVPWAWLRWRRPYFLWVGGSSPLGTVGIVDAALELAEQVRAGELPEPTHVLAALGSGGTAAGLLLGLELAGLATQVVAVQVAHQLPLGEEAVRGLARRAAKLLARHGAAIDVAALRLGRLRVERGFLGQGYGYPTEAGEAAIARARAAERLELEPVYTAKTMAALLALRARGELGDGPVLYWHSYNAREIDWG